MVILVNPFVGKQALGTQRKREGFVLVLKRLRMHKVVLDQTSLVHMAKKRIISSKRAHARLITHLANPFSV